MSSMKFQRRLSPIARAELIPMIDIVFQLVVFFMVSSTFILTPGIGLTFPESTTAEAVAMSRLVITVAGEEEVYLNRTRYTFSELDQALEELSDEQRSEAKTIILQADNSVSYGLIVRALDVLRSNGFQGVNLQMEEHLGE